MVPLRSVEYSTENGVSFWNDENHKFWEDPLGHVMWFLLFPGIFTVNIHDSSMSSMRCASWKLLFVNLHLNPRPSPPSTPIIQKQRICPFPSSVLLSFLPGLAILPWCNCNIIMMIIGLDCHCTGHEHHHVDMTWLIIHIHHVRWFIIHHFKHVVVASFRTYHISMDDFLNPYLLHVYIKTNLRRKLSLFCFWQRFFPRIWFDVNARPFFSKDNERTGSSYLDCGHICSINRRWLFSVLILFWIIWIWIPVVFYAAYNNGFTKYWQFFFNLLHDPSWIAWNNNLAERRTCFCRIAQKIQRGKKIRWKK